MGRPPRVLIAGGIYHVYNRVSHGAHIFRDEGEAGRLEALLAATKKRDDFQILAWCLMSNHYHLAVRMGEVSLSRSIRFLQHRFSQSYNGRHRVFGPLWQGRFRSKFVDDESYLRQLISYIHLNPVTAGVASDAEKYRWCGHREVVGRGVGLRLVNVDETLLAFGETRKSALAAYRAAMLTTLSEDWRREGPGRLPWWRLGRRPRADDGEEIRVDETRPRIGMDGRSNVTLRPRLDVEDFLEVGAGALEVSISDLRSRRRTRSIVGAREILAWLGVELYGFTVKEMSVALAKHLETTSRLVSRAAWRRVEDKDFLHKLEGLDSVIASSEPRRKRRVKTSIP
jgi:REP element-mobilizing transposase RayT